MTDIHNIEENKPHRSSMVICLICYKRWIAIREIKTKLIDLECAGCGLRGFTIETGEWIDE